MKNFRLNVQSSKIVKQPKASESQLAVLEVQKKISDVQSSLSDILVKIAEVSEMANALQDVDTRLTDDAKTLEASVVSAREQCQKSFELYNEVYNGNVQAPAPQEPVKEEFIDPNGTVIPEDLDMENTELDPETMSDEDLVKQNKDLIEEEPEDEEDGEVIELDEKNPTQEKK